ncbi:hypothetical protein TorRG33x02_062060, partial [Trema orientale]
ALEMGLLQCVRRNWQNVLVFLDSKELVSVLANQRSLSWRLSHIAFNVLPLSKSYCYNVFWIPRILNGPANAIAKWAFSSKRSACFALWEVPPHVVTSLFSSL